MNILLTGGFGRLGKLISTSLIEKGHFVICLDKNVPNEIPFSKDNFKIKFYEIDLCNKENLFEILENIIKTFKRVDVVINNAALREFNSFEKFSQSEIEKIINVNFQVPISIIRKILPLMIENNFGRIINISSISALSGYSSGSLYCSTKNALITFTESLAADLEKLNKNITANVLLPDSFQTREGIKLAHYDMIVNGIIGKIDNLIRNRINGKAILISPTLNKLKWFIKISFQNFQRIFL